ncbi:MAG TPA: SRPBCC family protein [Casimicrobiaceae bacterium]|nr:SRPBCC family protein [Casimicrobiaceae bacterium]
MKVELEKTFAVPGPAEVAWALLQDVEAVAGCMPGATITERLADGSYKGTVTVRVGPATMTFRGQLQVRDVDAAAHSLRLLGKGTDSTGTSGASMDLAARIESAGDGASRLVGKSEVTMSGKAATFGGRMMTSVADQILKQFAEKFAARVVAQPAPEAAPGPPPGEGAASTVPPSSRASSAQELNGLALLWAVFRDWLRSLFSRKTA